MSPRGNGVPDHFLVIVPGYMGSKLRDKTTGEVVWVDFGSIPKNPLRWDGWLQRLIDVMRYPNDALEAFALMDELVFVLPWAKQEHYGRLFAALEQIGYRADPQQYDERERNVYTFPYDWRQDNRLSARQLATAVERWRDFHPGAEAWIIAHSNGGLVARWYVEKEGGKDRVGRLILMGAPWDGTPVSMYVLVRGFDYLLRRGFNPFGVAERTRSVIRSFPSIYQLLPTQHSFVRDADGRTLDPFSDFEWLDTSKEKQLLLAGRRFGQTLGDTLSVETLCFFGRKRATLSSGVVTLDAGSRMSDITWYSNEAGDGTIPEYSAVHPRAHHMFPFAVGHGDIYAVDPVLEFLQWELRDKFRADIRALLELPEISVLFEPDRDVYAPGETVALTATVLGAEQDESRPPISSAAIRVSLIWKQRLPGDEAPPTKPPVGRTTLVSGDAAGSYHGRLTAPAQEGYYDLRATVGVPGQPPVTLSETLLIEAESAP